MLYCLWGCADPLEDIVLGEGGEGQPLMMRHCHSLPCVAAAGDSLLSLTTPRCAGLSTIEALCLQQCHTSVGIFA